MAKWSVATEMINWFYDWEKCTSIDGLNHKPMRTLGNKRPVELLREKLAAA